MFDVKFVDVGDLEKAVEEVLGDEFKPFVKVKALSVGGARNYSSVLVSAPNENIIKTIGKLIKEIDKEKPMIEIESLFVEVTMNDQDALGFNWSIFPDPISYTEIALGNNTILGGNVYKGNMLDRFGRTTGGAISAQLNQIAESGKGRVLSNTKIRTMSGRKSHFASEIQEPIMSLNGDSEVRVEYKNVGISLEAMATVLDDGSIYMKVNPRSSTITGEKTLRDSVAPEISERSVESEVILNPNETMIISGLMYDRDFVTKSRVPILSSIPLIGELFRNTDKRNERYQIFIYLRPRLVNVNKGSSGDADMDVELGAIWNRYAKLTASQAANTLNNTVSGDKREPTHLFDAIIESGYKGTSLMPETKTPEIEKPKANTEEILEERDLKKAKTLETKTVGTGNEIIRTELELPEIKNSKAEPLQIDNSVPVRTVRQVPKEDSTEKIKRMEEQKELEKKTGIRVRLRKYSDSEVSRRFAEMAGD
jgi:hypothetical protein